MFSGDSQTAMAIGTFFLALATFWMAWETHRLAKRSEKQAIATAEGYIMPKIVHNMRSKSETEFTKPLISFDFYENRPFYPVIRIRRKGKKEWEEEYKAEEYEEVRVQEGKTERKLPGEVI